MAGQAGGIGARLRAGREKMSLTVLQVAERIHTDPKIVEAIEVDNFEALGAPVYARGHIRHYAELVGESAPELTALYSDSSKVGQPDLTQIVKVPSADETNRLVAPALAVIAVFAVAGAIWWVSALSKKKPQLSETHVVGEEQHGSSPESGTDSGAQGTSQPAQTNPRPGVQTGSQPPAQTNPGERHTAAGGASTRQPTSASAASARPAAAQTHVASAGATANGSPGTSAGGSASTGATNGAASAPPHSTIQAQVTLRYSADSWTEVYDATGARLFYDVGSANSIQTLVGTPPLRVVLGNASGVAVEFNGHNMPIAKLAHPDGSVQFSINSSGRVVRAKPVADGG
jgi:cytoskeleton protein RodZ